MAKDEITSEQDAKPKEAQEPETPDIAETPEPKDSEQSEHADHSDLLAAKTASKHPARRFWHWVRTHKKLSVPLAIVVLTAVLLAVPLTRYKVLGLFVQKDFSVMVLDTETGKAVSNAHVGLAGKSAVTDAEGRATLKELKPGNAKLTVTKNYYQESNTDVLVSLSDNKNHADVKLQATGRQVPVSVLNRITGAPVKDATIKAKDAEAKTNDKGEATMVVSSKDDIMDVVVSAPHFNNKKFILSVNEEVSEQNKFKLTPSGKVYFLSKASGKVDVVKSNLDGSDRKKVVAGTGKEIDADTVLLATRDWKFLALKSRREGTKAKLYVIDTATDKMTVMDEGDADFAVSGWTNHSFVYTVTRKLEIWQPRRQAIKSYNADSKALTTLRESRASGTQRLHEAEDLGNIYTIEDDVLFTVSWSRCCSGAASKQRSQIAKVKVGTHDVSVLKSWSTNEVNYFNSRPYAPNEIYYLYYKQTNSYQSTPLFLEYEDGQIKAADIDEATYYKEYPRYILSPSGGHWFWADARDGKKTLFVGDKEAENEQQIAAGSEFTPYGWFGDEYLLVSKEDSELYIMANKKGADKSAVKITDYHKPVFTYRGYEGGY